MAPKKPSGRALLLDELRSQNPPVVTEEIARRLNQRHRLSETTLRSALRASGFPLAPLVEGVRQDDFTHLERTLRALAAEYHDAPPERQRLCRRAVITAKDHARWAMRKADTGQRARKEEMVLWMLTWLGNPGVFATWVELRKRVYPPAGQAE